MLPRPAGEENISVSLRSTGPRLAGEERETSVVEEAPELARAAGVLELAQGLGLDLADAFAGHRELLADFFQRVIGVHADAEAHAQHAFFARGERRQHARGGFTQVRLDGGVD